MNGVRIRKTHRRNPKKKAEPLAEGRTGKRKGRKYTPEEIEFIKRRYNKLVQKGLDDTRISKEIEKKLGRSFHSIRNKIKSMRRGGELTKNPNKGKEEFSGGKVKLIKKRYFELVKDGLNDTEISIRIEEEVGRTARSILGKIKHMRKNGEIEENPNNISYFSEKEIELIKRRYNELVGKGLIDAEIDKEICRELSRKFGSVGMKLKSLRKNGEIGRNPNTIRYAQKEIKLIKRRYIELVKEGLNDLKIAKIIGNELRKDHLLISARISRMRKSGKLRSNPNNRKEYSDQDIELIKRRYLELVSQGLTNDSEIARRIGAELERKPRCVYDKINKLKKAGELADAEALREREDILGVAKALEEFGED